MKIRKSHMRSVVAVSLFFLVFSSACIRFHRVPTEAALGSYHVSVRPNCQGSSINSLRHFEKDGSSSIRYYEFTCADTTVLIRGNMLSVNGKSYGALNEGDKVAVDHGKVRVNSEVRPEVH